MSQRDAILAALQRGQTITALLALQLFGCLRLAARINDLREEGFQITTSFSKGLGGKRYAYYSMEARYVSA